MTPFEDGNQGSADGVGSLATERGRSSARAKKKPGAGAAAGHGQRETTLGLVHSGPRLSVPADPFGTKTTRLDKPGPATENERRCPVPRAQHSLAITPRLGIGRKLFHYETLFLALTSNGSWKFCQAKACAFHEISTYETPYSPDDGLRGGKRSGRVPNTSGEYNLQARNRGPERHGRSSAERLRARGRCRPAFHQGLDGVAKGGSWCGTFRTGSGDGGQRNGVRPATLAGRERPVPFRAFPYKGGLEKERSGELGRPRPGPSMSESGDAVRPDRRPRAQVSRCGGEADGRDGGNQTRGYRRACSSLGRVRPEWRQGAKDCAQGTADRQSGV
jgi:hypothetical protein